MVVDFCRWIWLMLLSVQAVLTISMVLTNGSFLGYCQYGSVLPNVAAVCASIYHTIHTLTRTLILIITLNLTLISSYLRNKHQYAQPNMSAKWMTSRLCHQSAVRCKNCRPVPIGYTDNSLECADLSVCVILTIKFTDITEFLIVIIQSNCIAMDCCHKLQISIVRAERILKCLYTWGRPCARSILRFSGLGMWVGPWFGSK